MAEKRGADDDRQGHQSDPPGVAPPDVELDFPDPSITGSGAIWWADRGWARSHGTVHLRAARSAGAGGCPELPERAGPPLPDESDWARNHTTAASPNKVIPRLRRMELLRAAGAPGGDTAASRPSLARR